MVESWGKKDVRRKENKPLLLGTTKARDNGEATGSRFVEEAAISIQEQSGRHCQSLLEQEMIAAEGLISHLP